MAFNNPEIRLLYCHNLLIGKVWDTHNSLVSTSGKFECLVFEPCWLEFLSDFELLFYGMMEDGPRHSAAVIAAFSIAYGEEIFEDDAWRIEEEDGSSRYSLWQPPLIDLENAQISLRINWYSEAETPP